MSEFNSFLYSIKFPVILCITGFCIAQNTNFTIVNNAINSNNFKQGIFILSKIDTTKISEYDKATWLFYHSICNFKLDKHHIAYNNILLSKKKFTKLNKPKDVSDCNYQAMVILSHQNHLEGKDIKLKELIDEEQLKIKKNNDSTRLVMVYRNLASFFVYNKNGKEAINYFKRIIRVSEKLNDTLNIAYSYDNIGTTYQTTDLNNLDSAIYFTKKAEPYYIKLKKQQALSYNYNNQAEQQKLLGNYKQAIKLYLKADSIPLKEFVPKTKVIYYTNLADAYMLNQNYKNAALYLNKLNKLKDSINDTQQNIEISRIKEQYDNEKLRADNLESENRRKQSEAERIRNQNFLIGAIVFILFGGLTMLLIQKNTRKKQKLAEQAKALESQKLATVLKEQELLSIDAMIEGQEKERQRIANDLHDDLGGLMATVKLHFNALKEKPTDVLYDKTTTLLDEAYNKIRSIAHAKNSGVIAKQGLLLAVQDMAEKISVANAISIDVIDHGLEHRLENSLELTLFRIIQELLTNVIKHADATEVSIHLTNHEDTLNIMVEDNGKGFNTSQITTKHKGMGLSSIDKRVAFLNGTMTIESEIDQGTTIILDIPI